MKVEEIEAVLEAHAESHREVEKLRSREVVVCRCGSKHPALDTGRWPTHTRHVAEKVAERTMEHTIDQFKDYGPEGCL